MAWRPMSIDKTWLLQVNVNNIGDRLNYSQSFGTRGTPAPGRTVICRAGGQVLAMLVQIPGLLSSEQVAHIREQLAAADWVDGKVTAGAQSAGAKNNLQLPEDSPVARALGEIILWRAGPQ